jgi:iron complex transport system permease protein
MRLGLGYAVLFAMLALVSVASLAVGEGSLADAGLRSTLLVLRASRLGSAVLVGAALAVAGVIVQGLFRNPLADASVLGTSAGAALGGKVALLATEFLLVGRGVSRLPPDVLLPIGCLGGALVSLTVVLALVRRSRDVLSVLLTGFLLSSLSLSLGILVTSLVQENHELVRAMITLAVGTLTGAGPEHIAIATPLVVVGIAAAWFWAKPLDLLLSGDEEAASLGVDVGQVRRCCILWVAVLTAGAVAIGGDIAFVGLLVPHALRPLLGVEHRRLIPVAALGGAVFVAMCDLAVRCLPARTEVPLGVITGLIGAPVFLALLLRSRKENVYG